MDTLYRPHFGLHQFKVWAKEKFAAKKQ